MNREPLDKKLDDWLDQALTEYGRAEPRPGLEARTLAGVRSRLTRRPWWQWWPHAVWVSTAAVTIVLFMIVILIKRDKPPEPLLTDRKDHELLLGVDRLLNKEVPSALEPALVLTKEMAKNQ
jgi:hypothetical protein